MERSRHPFGDLGHFRSPLTGILKEKHHMDQPIRTTLNASQSGFQMAMHSHPMGQLSYIADGAFRLRTNQGRWIVPKGRIVWVPAEVKHEFSVIGASSSWSALLEDDLTTPLPQTVCILQVSPLLFAALERLVGEQSRVQDSARARNLVAVIRDELTLAEPEYLGLALPRSPALRKVADALIAEPADKRGIDAWAKALGLSRRTFTRRFAEETGASLSQWRRTLKLQVAMELLGAGKSVSDVAFALQYGTVSAFVEVFRKHYGNPPGQMAGKGR